MLVIREESLVEICDLLTADRFELVLTTVTFFKVLPRGEGMTWSGELGDHLVKGDDIWRIHPRLTPQQVWASVA
jgi:hypothetical protein